MSKPRSVVIGGLTWKIFWNKDIPDALGLTHYDSREIWLLKSMDEIDKKSVFLHELLHAIWWSYTLKPRTDKKHFEEDVVSQLAPAILHVLQDNKSIAKYLLEDA